MPRQRTTGPSFTRCRAPSRCPEFLGSLCSEPAAHDGQPKRPQNPRRTDRATTRGLTVSHPRCTMVGNRKHHRSVLRYRPDRGRDHAVKAEPLGEGGTRSEPRRWRLGEGPPAGVRSGCFRVLGRLRPAGWYGRFIPSIRNGFPNQDTRRIVPRDRTGGDAFTIGKYRCATRL